jgi:galactosyl transferase GMA12/MNN10 family
MRLTIGEVRMALCISVFDQVDQQVLLNHQHYCRLFGYSHRWVETAHIAHPMLRRAHHYHLLLQQLRESADNDWVLLLDSNAVIFHPVAMETLLAGRDALVVKGPTRSPSSEPHVVMNNMLALRNTAENRKTLHELIFFLHKGLIRDEGGISELRLLENFPVLGINAMIGDSYVNVSWHIGQWFDARIFIVNLGPRPSADGGQDHDILFDRRMKNILVQQINGALIDGLPLLKPPVYAALSTDPQSSFNPYAKIALVTLYTHHIAGYARISEHNVKRYCDRHGYAYHVYREIPPQLDSNISGSWVKSWLLARHLADHDWVIWVDADVLFTNQSKKLEPLLENRDVLFAKDIGGWDLNSGVMAFRHTAQNAALLEKIWESISNVDDKSTVYSSQGDQFHTIEVLRAAGMLNEQCIVDCLSINTPPQLSTRDTLLTHYFGWDDPYRAVYMAADDAMSQRG